MSARVVGLARGWIGTPYVHQASCRGAGADCLGLIRGVWRELYGAEAWELLPYGRDHGAGAALLAPALARHLIPKPLAQAALGDVLLFRLFAREAAKHVAIQSGADHLIHAACGHHIMEVPFAAPWRRRLVARYSWP